MPTCLHVQLVCVRVCGYTPHIAFIAWRSLCSVGAVGVPVPLRHWPNKRADWLKISYDSVSQKRKCAKDPEKYVIKQKTSARADKRTNVAVSTADSLRLTSCHVVSFRFACSLSLSRSHESVLVHSQLVEPFGRVSVLASPAAFRQPRRIGPAFPSKPQTAVYHQFWVLVHSD